MPSIMSCFGSTSCSMPQYSHPSAISSLSPHLWSCTLITTKTRIPTHPFTYWCPKAVCNSLFSPMQHPLQFLGHPAPFPTNSFGHALPHEEEESKASFLTVERKGSYCAEQIQQHIKYYSGESAQCGNECPGQHRHAAVSNYLWFEHLLCKEDIYFLINSTVKYNHCWKAFFSVFTHPTLQNINHFL